MKAYFGRLKQRYTEAVAAREVEPEVRPFINWADIRNGALGYTCETDAEIMRNVGSVNRCRLAEVVRSNQKWAWTVSVSVVAGLGFLGYFAARTSVSPIVFQPTWFAPKEVSSEEIASLQSSIKSTMTARLAGNYAKVIQDGITTRYPNWNQPAITVSDFNAAVRIAPADQAAVADRCATKIANGYPCNPQESILYRFLKFEDGAKAASAEDAQKVFLAPGQDLLNSYLAEAKFTDICSAKHSEKAFFHVLTQQEAVALVSAAKRAWLDSEMPKVADGFAKATDKAALVKASTLKGCELQPAMSLAVDAGPFQQLLQLYYRPQGTLAVEGVWIGLAEHKGRRVARLMGCSSESCSNSFGLDAMNYSGSRKAVDLLTSITSEDK